MDAADYRGSRAGLTEHDFLDQRLRKLSPGQRMRSELAAALRHRPSVVLLDEPSLGLDFKAENQIRRFAR